MEFDVRGVIQLAGTELNKNRGPIFPNAVTNIPIRMKFLRLHTLFGTGWSAEDGTRIGALTLHYADGRQQELPILYGIHLRNWVRPEPNIDAPETEPTRKAVVAWVGRNRCSREHKESLRLYRATWENPRPKVEVRSIDFGSALGVCAPFLIAITVD